MKECPKEFNSEKEMREFVTQCENIFDRDLDAAVAQICTNDEIKLVALSGPTCSGKTTTANKLIKAMSELNKKVHVISIDDFYYDRDVLIKRALDDPNIEVDYDSISTIDFEALSKCIEEIFSSGKTLVPRFDFVLGKRSGYVEYEPLENELFIFEGIQAIYPEITALFSQHPYKSIFISVHSGITVGDTVFERNEIRLMRRLVRDNNFRGADPEFTLYLWNSVRENEEKNIFPYANNSDIKIDSTLPFEIGILAPYLKRALSKVCVSSEYCEVINKILSKIEDIEEIPADFIAKNSLYHEFI